MVVCANTAENSKQNDTVTTWHHHLIGVPPPRTVDTSSEVIAGKGLRHLDTSRPSVFVSSDLIPTNSIGRGKHQWETIEHNVCAPQTLDADFFKCNVPYMPCQSRQNWTPNLTPNANHR
jgi:hypothetical protein